MNQLCIAFLPIVRVQFDVALADQMIQVARQNLQAAGFKLVGPEKPISDLESARTAVDGLASLDIDLLLVFQATFADTTMVMSFSEAILAPIFLWAVPEAWSGGRLRLNSLCGINLAGHALKLSGRKFDYAYTPPEDVSVIQSIRTLANAGRLQRRLLSARLGVVGEHPNGMETCALDEPRLKQVFGVEIERISVETVFQRARKISQADIDSVRKSLDKVLDNLATLEQKPLRGTLSVYQALKEISAEKKLDGLAVRDWPEFFTDFGCASDGALSMLSDGFGGVTPIPCSNEADINGTVTQLILQWLSNSPAFGTDMVGVDIAKDVMALWHSGLAPLSMGDPKVQKHGANHSNRGLPLIMDFPLKPGRVTVARVSQASGELSMVMGLGEILAAPKPFSGTSGVLRLAHPMKQFLDTLMHEGLEHHISLVYGDYLAELQAFASISNIPVLEL